MEKIPHARSTGREIFVHPVTRINPGAVFIVRPADLVVIEIRPTGKIRVLFLSFYQRIWLLLKSDQPAKSGCCFYRSTSGFSCY
jgi:hypothetical protein